MQKQRKGIHPVDDFTGEHQDINAGLRLDEAFAVPVALEEFQMEIGVDWDFQPGCVCAILRNWR